MYENIEILITKGFKSKYYEKEVAITEKYMYVYGLSISSKYCFNEIRQLYKECLIELDIENYLIIDKNKIAFRFRKNLSAKKRELTIGILRLNNIL